MFSIHLVQPWRSPETSSLYWEPQRQWPPVLNVTLCHIVSHTPRVTHFGPISDYSFFSYPDLAKLNNPDNSYHINSYFHLTAFQFLLWNITYPRHLAHNHLCFPQPSAWIWQGTTHPLAMILPPLEPNCQRLSNPKIRTLKFEADEKSDALLCWRWLRTPKIILLDDFRRLNANWRTLCTQMSIRKFWPFSSSFHVVLSFSVRSYDGK